MSSNKGTPLFTFLAGSVFGAVVALLYAPSSGEELRSQIRDEADVRWRKAQADLDQTVKSIQKSVDETRQELLKFLEQSTVESGDEAPSVEVVVEEESEG